MSKLWKELCIALIWIVVYAIVSYIAIFLSETIQIPNSITAIAYVALCAVIVIILWKRKKLKYYGFNSLKVLNSKNLLYYIPLIIVSSVNLWSGIYINDSLPQFLLITICMVCVAFIEEVIFRSFLMKALMNKSSVLSIVVSSSLFGLIHFLNIFVGADLISTILQVCYAMAFGFMCTAFFIKLIISSPASFVMV